ncbi:phosphodiesterase [Thiohalorhabdus sp.]|uniref:phosphodiesterase n=1 Tax=Thiohalorhabdus sp. TaxID=3094134 RepID=UPI002FC319D1
MTELLQITDTHLFAEPSGRLKGVDVDGGLGSVVADAARRHPQAEGVLLTGDLVHEETAASYRRLAGHMGRLGMPVFCLPGNHEDKALLAQACQGGALRCDQRVFIGSWQILLLDSARPPAPGGWLAREELDRAERALAEHPDVPALVALHHPPLSVNSPWMDTMQVANGGQLLALIDRHPQVRAVVFGHIHQAFETERNGVRFLGSPSSCAQFLPGAAASAVDNRPPGYRWLMLAPDGRLDTAVERAPWPEFGGPGSTRSPGAG